ncbi:MAG: hypothetical protein KYX64_04420 [Sphingopyxis sp.]|nr:hypothetical protein [Sphingopyxis sp.]
MPDTAFRNDPALKARAIADIADTPHPGWTNVATDEDRLACAETFGLSANLISLLSVASNFPYWDGSKDFMLECLGAISVGTDSLDLARQWAVSRWYDGDHAVGPVLAGTPAHAVAKAVFIAAGDSGERTVASKTWRQFRTQLAAIEGLSPPEAANADIAAALAWDETVAIGVYADVWKAWQEAIRIGKDFAAGWSQESQDQILQEIRDASIEAHARVSPRFGGEIVSEEAHAAQNTEINRILEASPLNQTRLALLEYWQSGTPAMMATRETSLATVRAACSGTFADIRKTMVENPTAL